MLLLLFGLISLNAFNPKFLNPATTQQIFIFTSLSIVAFLLFVTVLLLLVRNVLKLYADQRSRVMGARPPHSHVVGSGSRQSHPHRLHVCLLLRLMNRAVERWFSGPVTEMRDDSTSIALELSRYTTSTPAAEADSIATTLPAASTVSAASDGTPPPPAPPRTPTSKQDSSAAGGARHISSRAAALSSSPPLSRAD